MTRRKSTRQGTEEHLKKYHIIDLVSLFVSV